METKTEASFQQSFEEKFILFTQLSVPYTDSRIQDMFEETAGDFPTSQRLIHLPFHSTEKC